jgi:exonuclease SbcC
MKKLIKSIFHNFQSHAHTEILYADFTGIVGPSDKGKSALIRGIRWGLYNEPSGTEFIRHGQKECYVHHFFSDGTSIKRLRSDKENYYELYNADGTVMHLEAFGVGPVGEVVEFHGMREVQFFGEKQSLNLCMQLSQPFFLAENPIMKAVVIGKLANTDVVDVTIKNTDSEIRETKARAKKIKDDLSKNKEELKALKNLGKMERDIAWLEGSLKKMNELSSKLNKVENARIKIISLTKQKETLDAIISKEAVSNELVYMVEQISVLQAKLNIVSRLNKQLTSEINKKNSIEEFLNNINLDEVNAIITETDIMLESVQKVSRINILNKKLILEKVKASDLEKYMIDTAEINKVITNLDTCQQTLINVNKVKKIHEQLKVQLARKDAGNKVIEDLNNQYNIRVSNYKKALIESQICPICMSEITEEKVRDIQDIV